MSSHTDEIQFVDIQVDVVNPIPASPATVVPPLVIVTPIPASTETIFSFYLSPPPPAAAQSAPPTLENSSQSQITKWPRILAVLGGVMVIILIGGVFTTLTFMTPKHKGKQAPLPNPECLIRNFTVSKDGTSNFTTIYEAVEASPNHSPYRFCIYVRAGEYNETVRIGDGKFNLILMGEGSGRTIITSYETTWPQATLRVIGKNFLAQDLTIASNDKNALAVENLGEGSVFFRCKFEGENSTVHIKGKSQFYRSCTFYGRNNLVFGYGYAFFQKCEFLIEKSHPPQERSSVIFSQSSSLSTYDSVFVFHLCTFNVSARFQNSSKTTFLGGYLGDYASIVVMQSHLDASIGGYFLGNSPPNSTLYAVFRNTRPGASENTSQFIHSLSFVEAESEFSLRAFLGGQKWIPLGVAYDLDLAT